MLKESSIVPVFQITSIKNFANTTSGTHLKKSKACRRQDRLNENHQKIKHHFSWDRWEPIDPLPRCHLLRESAQAMVPRS